MLTRHQTNLFCTISIPAFDLAGEKEPLCLELKTNGKGNGNRQGAECRQIA